MNRRLIFFLVIISAIAGTSGAKCQPILRIIGGDTVNWGKVGAGKLRRTVEITNIGTDTLRITEVKPSCGCTTAPLDRKVLAPGDTGEMTIVMGVAGVGVERKQVVIVSNDGESPSRVVHLYATVVHDVMVSPASFPINRSAKLDSAYRAEVEIVNISDKAITISRPSVADTVKEARVRLWMDSPIVLQPQGRFQLPVEITPKVAGLHRINVVVPTSGEYTRELSIPAFFVVREGALIPTESSQ